MFKLPKSFENEIMNKTRLTKADILDLKGKIDSEYLSKLEKSWRSGKKSKEDKEGA